MEAQNTNRDLTRFSASNTKAFMYLLPAGFLALLGFTLALQDHIWLYGLGETVLSFFFLQTFIILHECAHLNYFKSRKLNQLFGHVFGFLSGIPFYTWQQMHNMHHRWTGWRDKDPSTEETVRPSTSRIKNAIVNVAWWLFIPLFYMSYKISNYWNLIKIKRFLKPGKFRIAFYQVGIYLIAYVAVGFLFSTFIWKFILPAFLLSLVWKELVIMTQHSHVDIPISDGQEVKPISYTDQVQYTRSFYTHPFVSQFLLLNFNLHEAHHAYPGIPAYWLHKVELNTPKEPTYLSWFVKAKTMRGVDYVFKTSKQTGKKF